MSPGRTPLALACAALALATACAPSPTPPSLVLVVIDTLRRDHLSLHGYEHSTSPALDALARESAVFERCLATSPWTLPSTISLLSGLYPTRHGVQTVVGDNRLGDDVVLLSERLSQRGYRTAAFSANPYVSPYYGLSRGFDQFRYYDSPAARFYQELPALLDEARRWLDEDASEPFFLYLHAMNVHGPYKAPDEYRARFLEAPSEPFPFKAPPWDEIMRGGCRECEAQVTPERLRDLRARYDGAIGYTDALLGAFFAELGERGLLERSVLVVTADHGEELFDHRGLGHGKTLYGEVLNVPLLIRPPGGLAAPRRIDTPVSLVDLPATLLDLLDSDDDPGPEAHGDGRSLAPLVRGEPAPAALTERSLLAEVNAPGRGRATLLQRWPHRLIAIDHDYRNRSGIVELFDVGRDPGEQHDLSSADTQRTSALAEELAERRRELRARSATADAPAAIDPEQRRQLEALGYEQGD